MILFLVKSNDTQTGDRIKLREKKKIKTFQVSRGVVVGGGGVVPYYYH